MKTNGRVAGSGRALIPESRPFKPFLASLGLLLTSLSGGEQSPDVGT